MNTSSIWPLRTSTTAAPRREARKPTASASASTKPSCRSSIRWRSANASTPASSSCRLTSIPGSPGTTSSDHIRGVGATARRQCKPSLTPSHSPGRNRWPPDVGQTQPFRHQTGQLSDQVSASTVQDLVPARRARLLDLLVFADAGIVDEDVEAPKLLCGAVDEGEAYGLGTNVSVREGDLGAGGLELGRHALAALAVPIAECHARALGNETPDRRLADP